MNIKTYLLFGALLSAAFVGCGPSRSEVTLYYPAADSSAQAIRETFTILGGDTSRIDGIYKAFYKDGKPMRELEFKDGLLWNVIAQRGPAGQMLDSTSVRNGNGVLKTFDLEGNLVSTHTYQNGRLTGHAEYVDPNGMTLAYSEFRAGVPLGSDALFALQPPDTSGLDSLMRTRRNAFQGQNLPNADPAVADRVMAAWKSGNAQAVYGMYMPQLRAQLPVAVYQKYYHYINQVYGAMESFRRVDFAAGQDPQIGVGLQAMYEVKFKYVKALVVTTMILHQGKFHLADIQFQTEPYTPLFELRSFGDPAMKLFKAKDWEALYASCSQRLKTEVTLDQFKASMEQVAATWGTLSDFNLQQNQITLDENRLVVMLIYEATFGSKQVPVQLVFTQFDTGFQLESLSTVSPEELQQMQQMQQQMMQQGGGGR